MRTTLERGKGGIVLESACEVCGSGGLFADNVCDQLLWCPRCQHAVRVSFGSSARVDEFGGSAARDELRLRLTYQRIRRRLSAYGQISTVFDVGFGGGQLLRRFFDDGAEVAGCEFEGNARDLDEQVERFAKIHWGSLETVDVTEPFDLVLAVHVVEHLPDVRTSMQQLAQLVKPGGCLFIVTPTAECIGYRRFGSDWWMLEDPTHVRFFSETSLSQALDDVDLQGTIYRPWLDSLGSDGASMARRAISSQGMSSIEQPLGKLLSMAAGPLAVAKRGVSVDQRPVIETLARKSGSGR